MLCFEKHGFDLRMLVLEGKVEVAGIGPVQVGNLPGDTDEGETVFKQGADGTVQLGNRQDLSAIHGKT